MLWVFWTLALVVMGHRTVLTALTPLGPAIGAVGRRRCDQGGDKSTELGADLERLVDRLPRVLPRQSQRHAAAGRRQARRQADFVAGKVAHIYRARCASAPPPSYTYGEATSQSPWSRYDLHFVGRPNTI